MWVRIACFAAAVSAIVAQGEGEFEMVGGTGEFAGIKLDVPQSVPDVALELAAAELVDQFQRVLTEHAGLLVVGQQGRGTKRRR